MVALLVMKQYVIDELRFNDYEKIKQYLDDHFHQSGVKGIYWIPLDKDCLTTEQALHEECQPHYFFVALEETALACEMLIRTENRIRCSCMGYADEKQQRRIIQFADNLLDDLDIKI